MIRCPALAARHLARAALWTPLLLVSLWASAQELVRPFPAAARTGTLEVLQPPLVLIDGQPARLSPGARIRGTSNSIVLSASLVGQTLRVNYLPDAQGMVHEVWILTAQEARARRPAP